jgi:hypothetical protein
MQSAQTVTAQKGDKVEFEAEIRAARERKDVAKRAPGSLWRSRPLPFEPIRRWRRMGVRAVGIEEPRLSVRFVRFARHRRRRRSRTDRDARLAAGARPLTLLAAGHRLRRYLGRPKRQLIDAAPSWR